MKNFNSFFNQLTAMPKRLAMVLTVLFTLGVGSMWGQTFTRISAASDLSDGDEIIFVDQAGEYACGTTQQTNNRTLVAIETNDNSYSYQSSDNVQVFVVKKNGTNYGFHTGAGYIYSASSSKNNLKTNNTASTTSPTGTSAWTLSVSGNVFTVQNVTNNSYYLALNMSNNPKLFSQYKSGQSKPYIYKKVTSTYEIIAKSNNETYGTVLLTGTTITASPKTGYTYANPAYTVTAGSATVSQNGNTFTVNPTSNCTVRINFTEKLKNTYIDQVQGNSESVKYDTHNTPTLADKTQTTTGTCEQLHWHFMGWVTEANKANPTDANIVKAGASVPADGTTYYAVWAKGEITGGSTAKQYSFDITKGDFNTTSYVANNNSKTSTAKASDNSTKSVSWTSNQVMQQSSTMQWQNGKGYIYNTTDLGNITNITITSTAGTFTTYYGTSQQPSQETSVGTGNGYFQIKVGSATGKVSTIKVTFTQTVEGETTTDYFDYITQCTTKTSISLYPNFGSELPTVITTGASTYEVPPCSFTRTGYTFSHWDTKADDSGSDYDPGDNINLNGTDVNLYAIWTPQTYDITYKDQGDVAFSGTHGGGYPTKHTYGTATTLKSATKSGYNFLGWFTTSDCSSSAITQLGATEYTSNITLYAKWEVAVITYTITCSVNEETTSKTYEQGATIEFPAVTPCDGMDLVGWTEIENYANETTAPSDLLTTATAEKTTTYYAVFAKLVEDSSAPYQLVESDRTDWSGKYLIAYSSSVFADGRIGGKTADGSIGKTGNNVDLSSHIDDNNIPADHGNPYHVKLVSCEGGGYLLQTQDGKYNYYSSNANNGLNANTDKTYAEPYKLNVIFNSSNDIQLALSGNAAGSVFHHNPSDQIFQFYKNASMSPVYLYRQNEVYRDYSTRCRYTVTFDANGHGEAPESQVVYKNELATDPGKKLEAVGYTFQGWYDNQQCTGNPYNFATPITDNITLYAKWTPTVYAITYKDQGDAEFSGSHESGYPTQHTYNTNTTLKTASKAGHTFGGWYDNSNCTGTALIQLGATDYTGDITLYAKWTVNKYTITFKNYDGTELQSSEVAYGETPSYTGETPTREQTAQYTYTFKGWSPTIASVTQDQVYTAQFTQTTRQYTVTWYDGTGNAHKTQSANYNATISVPTTDPDPCDNDYPHFIGWTADPFVGSTTTQPELVENVKVTGDCDYYAVFAKGEGGSSDYKLVTSAPADWSGTYLIVNTDDKKAWKGSATSDNGAIDVTITNNTITSNATTDNETFTIATMTGGYSIKGTSGKYISGTDGSNATNYKDAAQLNTISIDNNNNVTITSNTSVLRQNNSNASLFRYYKSSTYSSQHPIQLYKKGSGVNYTSFITTCCTSWTAPTLTYATPLNAEERQTAQPQFGNGTTYGNPTYTSSKPSVLSVDEATGEVTAVSKGTATITVTWEGDETYCSVSATSNTITVNGSYSVTFQSNGGTGTMEPQKADPSTQLIAKLNKNEFTKAGYVFVGWKDASGNAYTDEQENITLTKNLTLYAQWAAIVTLNDAGNVTTTHPETAGGSITLEDGANACDPYEFVGWTTVATGDWNEGINEPALVATTYTPNAPTTLYAVYKIQSEGNANAFKLSFEGSNGNTYYVDEYSSGSSPLRGYSNITKEEAATFIRTKMYPNDDTRYYVYMEEKGEYLYYNGYFNTTSSNPDENQGWVFHTVGDKIKLQSTYSYDPEYLSFSDRDQETINMGTNASGSEFNMLPAVTSTYVAAPLCEKEITITFETGNGDFVANAPATNPLTVTQGETITLPTCEYPGYEFMGWMKDEQQLDPSDIIGTYYTGDYTVDGVSSTITFYAYYKVIPEEVEFTGKDDVELLMYYYDGTENYYYAVSHAAERGELSSKQNCFNATTWTFTNVGNMQYHIQDETGKYLGAYSDGDNDLILSATPKVWTFTEVNGLWKMVCENSPSRALMYISEGNRFTNAAITNEGNGAYNYITLGICPYPTYTTNPVLTQGFIVTNTAMVTSASGQKIKAANALTLETRNVELPCTFTITAPNITFYDNTGAEVTQLTASAASEQFELYFAYKPTAENTMEYPTITIVDDEMKTYTIKNRIYARSLPNTFAVVAKVGSIWYALPSQGLNSTTPPAAYPVEVDNVADPTVVAAVPANADWSLRQVYEASRVDATKDRFVANGENFVFVNNEGTPKALNASASGNYLLTDAQYSGYYETNPGLYEWTPTTSDLETYTLTNAQRTDRTLNVSINNIFGVHSDNKATTEVRFLPLQDRYIPMAAQVVEWKENSVVVMYNGDPAQTASVSVSGAAAQNTTLSAAQRDIAVYELAATGLADNPTQRLSITIGTEKVILPIPYIVSGAQTDYDLLPGSSVSAKREAAKIADLIVLNAATLTADGSKSDPYKFRNVTIYGGGSLVIPSDKGFGANSLTMRVGGVEAGEYLYTYPQLDLNGTINSGNINLDLMTTNDYYYPFSVPYEVTLADIHYPVEIYGSNVKPDNKGSFLVSYYDGEARSQGNTGWKDVEEQGKTVLSPHVGYSIWGLPKKVSVNGATSDRQTYGIHRIPMKKTADVVMSNETTNKNVDIFAHNATRDNDKGWNFIGNPYLVQHGGLDDDTDVYMGLLVKEMKNGQWTGGWVFNGEQVRYVTQTNDCLNYTSTPVADATIPAFSAFFIQAKETGVIAFTSPNVAAAQSLTARRSDENKEITTGIILLGEKHSDRTGLLIADEFTEAYEFNADLSKFDNQDMNLYTISPNGKLAFMAINEELAKQTIPLGYSVSADGMYTIAFDEQRYNCNDIYALYLIDYDRNETTNLLHMDYDFYSDSGASAERFALQVAFAPSTTTDIEYTQVGDILVSREGNTLRLDNLPSDATVTVYDAVGHLVEQHTASQLLQLTLQKGYYLLHIGNNQNSVVIDTFIP